MVREELRSSRPITGSGGFLTGTATYSHHCVSLSRGKAFAWILSCSLCILAPVLGKSGSEFRWTRLRIGSPRTLPGIALPQSGAATVQDGRQGEWSRIQVCAQWDNSAVASSKAPAGAGVSFTISLIYPASA